MDFSLDNATIDKEDEIKRMVWNEGDRSYSENAPKTVQSKINSISTLLSDWFNKLKRLERVPELITKYQNELEKFGDLSPEQIKQIEEQKKERELYKYIKEQIDNIKIKSLDDWLEEYKTIYESWVMENLKGYEQTRAMRETETVVRNQKISIVVKSYERVGEIKDIKFGRLGSDGTFNGTVIGEKGTANIETILAGGYNIQRLHYRVLVK
ncbi:MULTISPECIES: hypothetical protein [Vagococcus]|uniref:Uncharacterized protein n=1 Tax=Vagococcus fluvialis bH819 TaxID=1255619 RepID=A0A1X6WS63_9ENTE|nr:MULTISPECIES: hypothetical protein [Vagococcus]SLM87108.1 hypothetical protein FM121_13500 [Vagococcus fluvialis bH819]HCM90611.1 hypothetical protein [Vagococcus sp.]